MRKLVLGTVVLALGACGGDNTNEVGVVFGGDQAEDAAADAYQQDPAEAAEDAAAAPDGEEAAEAAEASEEAPAE